MENRGVEVADPNYHVKVEGGKRAFSPFEHVRRGAVRGLARAVTAVALSRRVVGFRLSACSQSVPHTRDPREGLG